VQPGRLQTLQQDHLDWPRPARGPGPHQRPAREPMQLPLLPACRRRAQRALLVVRTAGGDVLAKEGGLAAPWLAEYGGRVRCSARVLAPHSIQLPVR
jgi:hypothetical protein